MSKIPQRSILEIVITVIREEDHGELALPEAHHLYSRAFS